MAMRTIIGERDEDDGHIGAATGRRLEPASGSMGAIGTRL
jgi:hypothetical protein